MTIVKFPTKHVDAVDAEAQEQARLLGHELGDWFTPSPGWPWKRYSYCRECGAYATLESKTIDSDKLSDHLKAKGIQVLREDATPFLKNEPLAEGDALEFTCPAPNAPYSREHQGRLGPKNSKERRAALKRAAREA
jgi:hypothetical protein